MAHCQFCGNELEKEPLVHNQSLCEKTELLRGRQEISKLKKSIEEWKDAWYQLREIIGNLWWHHPAIDSEQARAYYQSNLKEVQLLNELR